MGISKRITKKSAIYEFDGFCPYYRAYVQGAFVGTYIVPLEYDHLITPGHEAQDLQDMRATRQYGIVLRGARHIQ